ncbi:MAG: methylenetetrahydrofolate reductase C-terminal domain-containing protein [Candidatus Omnitrophica bacterium]|nr:methylenetetrahydrofolate reductase C-terminal domain-containing protein [Candidatus Omnitrophota bacterium]
MILTEKKPLEEILSFMQQDENIFLLACGGCPESAEIGGEAAVLEMKEGLEKAGKTITGYLIVDFLCNKVLATMRIIRHKEKIAQADAILVLSCGIGVQAVSSIMKKMVYPALNTISMGGFQGLWPGQERCEQCGECILNLTGGICPITFCSKTLLNGPCGGAKDGKCEIDKEKDCGWHLIYERLKKVGRLDKLKEFKKARNFKKMEPNSEVRKKRFFDIEQ